MLDIFFAIRSREVPSEVPVVRIPRGPAGCTEGRPFAVGAAAPDAPPLAFTEVSFLATAGQDEEIRIDYVNGDECLRFRLDDDALTRRPNGTPMNEGDTITIRIRVVDNGYFNFEFQPAGLRFAEPAELRVNYQFAHPDLNGDGEVNEDDDEFEFGWWRQEMPGQKWEPVGSVRVRNLTEVRAEIDGFTRYALAGGN